MRDSDAANSYTELEDDRATTQRFLVFARVGSKSLHREWLVEPRTQRNWDLQLSTYVVDADDLSDGDFPLSIDTGTKWDSVCRYFAAQPELLDRYDYIMFPDDDLLFAEGGISELFRICTEEKLEIAQPSLTLESYFSYPIVLWCPGLKLRYSNFVEPMCPIIRTSYLKLLLPQLARWNTGWGQDDIWTLMMPEPAYRSALIDAAPIVHTRPLYTGDIYKAFTKMGKDPHAEMAEIRQSFSNLPNAKLIYGGISRKGRPLGSARTNLLNGLRLIRIASRARDGKSEAVRTGCGMLIRMVTRLGYKPKQVKQRPAAEAATPRARAVSVTPA